MIKFAMPAGLFQNNFYTLRLEKMPKIRCTLADIIGVCRRNRTKKFPWDVPWYLHAN